MNRRHDIDALRALAFALVILYHVAMYYVDGWAWHLKSPHAAAWLQSPMRILNLWRMDLVFLVSGLALAILLGRSAPGALLRQRSWRLLLPLAFGMAVVVPFQPYAQALANGATGPGFGEFLLRYFTGGPWPKGAFDGSDVGVTWNHLWYLPYLWVYTVLAVVLLRSRPAQRLQRTFLALRGWRLVLLPVLPLAAWSVLLWPHFPPTRDLVRDGWLHAVYFTLFLYGCWIGTDAGWWDAVRRRRWPLLAGAGAALGLTLLLRLGLPPAGPSPWRLAVRLASDAYLWLTILAILGWAHQHLNRPWPWLRWSNESVYPWYVLHQTVLVVAIFWLAPLALGPVVEPLLLVAATIAGCWAITAVVRRVRWLRPLFGLGPRPQAASAASMSRARDSGLSIGA